MHQKTPENRIKDMNKNAGYFKLSLITPPRSLFGQITARIRYEAKKAARRLAYALGAAAFVSFAALVTISETLFRQAYSSSAWQYLSLIFSDTGAALSAWKEISLSVIESAPVAALGIFLAALFVLLFALKLLTESIARYSRIITTA